MKKIILSILYILISIVSVYSQSNYKEGYIITNSNDTVFGLIDFRTDQTNSLVCKFKKDENTVEKSYSPGEILSYRFINEGKYYVSQTVVIDSLSRTVFLEFLVQGLLNLYYFPEGNGYYFFENKDGALVSITKKPDEIVEEYKLKEDNRYKGILSYISKDCIPLAVKTSKIKFNKESMIVFTKDYHDQMCDSGEKCIIFENDYKKKFTVFDFSFYSGVELNNTRIYIAEFTDMLSISPVIGADINVISPRISNSLNVTLGTSVSKIAGGCDFVTKNMVYSQYKFSGIKTNFSAGLEYIYPKGKIRPAINGGLTYNRFLNLKSTLTTDYDIFENKILIRNSTAGIKTGAGIDYKIKDNQFIVFRLMYFRHFNLFDMNETYQLKLGYKF